MKWNLVFILIVVPKIVNVNSQTMFLKDFLNSSRYIFTMLSLLSLSLSLSLSSNFFKRINHEEKYTQRHEEAQLLQTCGRNAVVLPDVRVFRNPHDCVQQSHCIRSLYRATEFAID